LLDAALGVELTSTFCAKPYVSVFLDRGASSRQERLMPKFEPEIEYFAGTLGLSAHAISSRDIGTVVAWPIWRFQTLTSILPCVAFGFRHTPR
jgi:hypothetical protein